MGNEVQHKMALERAKKREADFQKERQSVQGQEAVKKRKENAKKHTEYKQNMIKSAIEGEKGHQEVKDEVLVDIMEPIDEITKTMRPLTPRLEAAIGKLSNLVSHNFDLRKDQFRWDVTFAAATKGKVKEFFSEYLTDLQGLKRTYIGFVNRMLTCARSNDARALAILIENTFTLTDTLENCAHEDLTDALRWAAAKVTPGKRPHSDPVVIEKNLQALAKYYPHGYEDVVYLAMKNLDFKMQTKLVGIVKAQYGAGKAKEFVLNSMKPAFGAVTPDNGQALLKQNGINMTKAEINQAGEWNKQYEEQFKKLSKKYLYEMTLGLNAFNSHMTLSNLTSVGVSALLGTTLAMNGITQTVAAFRDPNNKDIFDKLIATTEGIATSWPIWVSGVGLAVKDKFFGRQELSEEQEMPKAWQQVEAISANRSGFVSERYGAAHVGNFWKEVGPVPNTQKKSLVEQMKDFTTAKIDEAKKSGDSKKSSALTKFSKNFNDYASKRLIDDNIIEKAGTALLSLGIAGAQGEVIYDRKVDEVQRTGTLAPKGPKHN